MAHLSVSKMSDSSLNADCILFADLQDSGYTDVVGGDNLINEASTTICHYKTTCIFISLGIKRKERESRKGKPYCVFVAVLVARALSF